MRQGNSIYLPPFSAEASVYRSTTSYRTASLISNTMSESLADTPQDATPITCGAKVVTVWLNAFIPNYIPGLTTTISNGPNTGLTKIPGPTSLNDCYLTDQRTYNPDFARSSRIHALVGVNLATGAVWYNTYCDNTVEVDCLTGVGTNCNQPGAASLDPITLTSTPVAGGTATSFNLTGNAKNPCAPFVAPYIDFTGTVTITELTSGEVDVNFTGTIEPFPAFEMYASADGGPPLQIFKAPPVLGADPWNLYGPVNRDVVGSVRLTSACPECQTCADGYCSKIDCVFPCLTCRDGTCVPKQCGDCEVCDAATGECQWTCGECQECIDGACQECQGLDICCNGVCVDSSQNVMHCGTCNSRCIPPRQCVGGSCHVTGNCPGGTYCWACDDITDPTTCRAQCVSRADMQHNCILCGNFCQDGHTCCGYPHGCVDLANDPLHCGACNHACTGEGQICQDSVCACPAGQSLCNNVCVDLSSDPTNCGTCGFTCSMDNGESCCDGVCNNFQSDSNNCGACGHACDDGSCSLGQCVCASDQTSCSKGDHEQCVNLLNDAANCGTCNNACGAVSGAGSCSSGPDCCYGYCVDYQSCAQHCGGCGMACPNGQSCCHGSCKDLQVDDNNCGQCDRACIGGQCNGGTCYCTDGKSKCPYGPLSEQCVNFQTDNNNCGGCGDVCMGGQFCSNGACVCPSGQIFCGGVCVNPQVDDKNCGSCGYSCWGLATCNDGKCTCPSGYQAAISPDGTGCCPLPWGACGGACCTEGFICCGGQCVNYNDPNHCGSCGTKCANGQICSGGKCICPKGVPCNGACCPSGLPCCHINGTCCDPGSHCCPGGGCCPANSVCPPPGSNNCLPQGATICPDQRHYCPADPDHPFCCSDSSACCSGGINCGQGWCYPGGPFGGVPYQNPSLSI